MEKLRVGLVGTGKFAGHHARVWRLFDDIELTGVTGSDVRRTEEFAGGHHIKAIVDPVELFQCCDLVDIVSNNATHSNYALMGIDERCHLIIEKPIAISVAEAERVCTNTRVEGVIAAVVSNYRYRRCFQELLKIIRSGIIGEIIGCQVTMVWPRNASYFEANGGWRQNKKLAGGGVLIHQGIHYIDLLHWLFGSVFRVNGRAWNWVGGGSDVGVEQTFAGVAEFDSGVPVTVFFSTMECCRSVDRIEVFGTASVAGVENGRVTISGETFAKRIARESIGRLVNRLGGDNHKLCLRRQFSEVVTAIRNGDSVTVSVEDGLCALKTIDAFYQSSEQEGRGISLKLEK